MKEIINFIEANVNGRTLFTEELIYKLENGALQGVYSDQISFSNLKYSQSGFQLDMFIISNEKIWLMGEDGQREELRKDFSAVSLFRFKPVAFQAEHRFYNEDGKLHYEYNGRCFDVHTETMQRSRSSDTFPPFLSVEK